MNKWYLGSMNDGLFIIDTPPRPSTDDVNHSRGNGPTLVLNVTSLSTEKAQAIVDAHNLAGDGPDKQSIADAHLIAAAPDLLGAMRFILAFYEPGQRHLDTEAWKVAEASARRAVAKAEGGAK